LAPKTHENLLAAAGKPIPDVTARYDKKIKMLAKTERYQLKNESAGYG
jgi:hypothetical protein